MRRPSCLAEVWEALAACLAAAYLDGDRNSHAEGDTAGIRLAAADSTADAEYD